MVPKTTANGAATGACSRELAAQADIILSSGRYLRDWANGRAQEILQVDDSRFADLRQWRIEQGLSPHPDIAILSASLDFLIPPVLTAGGRRVIIFTTAGQDPQRVEQIQAQAGEVIVAGEGSITGQLLLNSLAERGYHTRLLLGRTRVLHLLLAGGALDRLY